MIGDRIRKFRKMNHLSQEEVANKLGVSLEIVCLWENNQVQPNLESIVFLSKLLGVSTDELLTSNENEHAVGYSEPVYVPTPAPPPISQPEASFTTTSEQPQKKQKSNVGLFCILVFLLIVGFLASWILLRKEAPLSAEEIYAQISPSVVEIIAESPNVKRTGTGFFLDENGTVITNYHVIEGCKAVTISLSNGISYSVTGVLGYDSSRDIAILSTNCYTSSPLLIQSKPVKTGEKVYALGSSQGFTGSLSDGIISAVDREIDGNVYLQTTAPISQGNSGGPLVDSTGAVIGIICASFTDGQNLNFAIPIKEINSISLNDSLTLDRFFSLTQDVEWISDWEFFYYKENDSYVLLFQLKDSEEIPVSSNGTVDIRIVNDRNVTVYNKTIQFFPNYFENWIYDESEEKYLATIYISPRSITNGTTRKGTLYFEVYGDNYAFDECSYDVDCLPVGTPQKNTDRTIDVRTITYSNSWTAEKAVAMWKTLGQTEEALIKMMDIDGADQGGGKLHTISIGDFVREVDDWCFSSERQVGDYAIIENPYGHSWVYISSLN